MMESLTLRKATASDTDQLQQISRQTFYETFSAGNTEENMQRYLEESFSVAKLSAELGNASTAFYFAIVANQVVGYLKLNIGQAQTELKDDKGLEIERIYVLKDYHGRKVGQLLYNKAIEVARERTLDYI